MKAKDLSAKKKLLEWKTFEVCLKKVDGGHSWPFSEELIAGAGSTPVQAITKMNLVETWGWPDARDHMKDDKGKNRIVPKGNGIWLLKCTPKCWRLYFYVSEGKEENRIVYLRAVCKKQDDEDEQDAIIARRRAADIRSGRSGITPFEPPT